MNQIFLCFFILIFSFASQAGVIKQVKDGKALITLDSGDSDVVVGDRLVVLDDISEGESGVVQVEKSTMTTAIASILKGRVKVGFMVKKKNMASTSNGGRSIAGEESEGASEEAQEERRQLRAKNRLQDSGFALGWGVRSTNTTATQKTALGNIEIQMSGTGNGPFLSYESLLRGGWVFLSSLGYQTFPYQNITLKDPSGTEKFTFNSTVRYIPLELELRNFGLKRNKGLWFGLGIGYYAFSRVDSEVKNNSADIFDGNGKAGLLFSIGYNVPVNASHIMLKVDGIKIAEPTKNGVTPSTVQLGFNVGYFF